MLIGLFMLVAATTVAAGIPVELALDTYIDAENASESFGDEETLWATSVGGEPVKEIYLNFNNTFARAKVFSPDQIESATLTLDATDVEVPGEISIYFAEGTIIDIDWDTKIEYETNESVSVEIDQEDEYSIDVTQLVKRAREACPEDCGYSLVIVAENDTSVGFASSESSEAGPELEYTANE